MLNHTKQILTLPDSPFILESGATLPEVEIAYDTYGALNSDRSNVVVILHALTGWPAAHEWWSGLVGEGRVIDPEKYFVICPNFLGSCCGSTGPESIDPSTGYPYHANFPTISTRDIAKANLQLLDQLGIEEVALAIGGSMGGMVLLEMAALDPNRFRAIIPIAVSGEHSAWRIAFSSTIRKAITAHDPSLADADKLRTGLHIARQFATISYRCSQEFDTRFAREQSDNTFEVENYLHHQGDKIVERFSPYSYLTLTKAMELYDLKNPLLFKEGAGGGSTINCPALFIGITSDILYEPDEIVRFAATFPQGQYHTLHADHGHDSFLVDADKLAELIEPFINSVIVEQPLEEFAIA